MNRPSSPINISIKEQPQIYDIPVDTVGIGRRKGVVE